IDWQVVRSGRSLRHCHPVKSRKATRAIRVSRGEREAGPFHIMYHRHGCHIMLTRKRRSVSIVCSYDHPQFSIVCSYDHPQFQVTDLCWKRGREVYCIGMPVSHVARLAEPGVIRIRTLWEEYAELENALRN